MSSKPTLVFLHGVGTGDVADGWKSTLASSLQELGYPGLDGITVVAPKYPNALRGVDDKLPLPKITVRKTTGDAARDHRRGVERRTGGLETLLSRSDRGKGWAAANAVADFALEREKFTQARNYLRDSSIRAYVLTRVLNALPTSGDLVIVAHSLGTVVACDLIRRLPAGIHVRGLVTLGSPLPNPEFDVDGLGRSLDEPPQNLDWWVNFWNSFDPVTTHRGLSHHFPWVLDQRIQGPANFKVHDVTTYLASPGVATTIGFPLHGSLSTGLVLAESGFDLPLDYSETVAVMALRYGHKVGKALHSDIGERYRGALRQVQASTHGAISDRCTVSGRTMRRAISALAFDIDDPDSAVPCPDAVQHLDRADAIVPLLSVAAANILLPFEIDVPTRVQREAMTQLTVDMGLGSRIGEDVFAAMEEARGHLKTGGPNWFKWLAIGIGATAVVAATGGLALAAAPGAFGAAAITSALAAFGPGGMIGGLLTAGALVSAGSSGIAAGLASSTTSAQAVEAVVVVQLAAAILRRKQLLEQDPATWHGLVETSTEVRREQSRLVAFSDDSAPTLKQLDRKIKTIENAIDALIKMKLTPSHAVEDQDEKLRGETI